MNKVVSLRLIFLFLVVFSIFTIYHSMVTEEDYVTFMNQEGPDTSDYFLLEAE